ncbi:MAG: methylcrotonoyl-CoA carboxylase, partial [Alphaproteobacteria bacterium]|nr:methylcrotonoyl-CoA carboxylase [Alphaproteobacteria bacterium]
EAPAPGMDAATRKAVTDAAVRAAKAVNYEGAGTIEFIADASDGLKADRIWFMEMNTRLQVEHPVTEAITGVDLVEWQLRVAAGEPIPLKQADIPLNGWAMEARLYAEDPANGFLPSIGKLDHFVMPDNARVDTGVERGGEVSQFYDPMIAKLIVHADTREAAAEALADACASVEVWPVKTNAGFLVRCLEHPRFVEGDVDTGFIGAEEAALLASAPSENARVAALNLMADNQHFGPHPKGEYRSPWESDADSVAMGFRLNAGSRALYRAGLHNELVEGSALSNQSGDFTWKIDLAGRQVLSRSNARQIIVGGQLKLGYVSRIGGLEGVIFERGDAWAVAAVSHSGQATSGPASDGSLRAPMPGKIVATPAKPGDTVTKGQPVVVLEAMKMEHALVAPFDGVVGEIAVDVGDQVADGTVLATVNPLP